MDVSVVVPVYNVQKYILECVKSIYSQSFRGEMELILVNDGTKDDSIRIVKDFFSDKKQIEYKIVTQDNQGLPAARNAGLKVATGKYICFIDSDDIISEEHINNLYECCIQNHLEVAFSDFEYTSEKKRNGKLNKNKGQRIISRDNFLPLFLEKKIKVHCCAMIMDREKLLREELYFNPVLRYGEDTEFMWRFFPTVQKVGFVECKSYKYLQREGSIMRKQSFEQIQIAIDSLKIVEKTNLKKYGGYQDVFQFISAKTTLAFLKTAAENNTLKMFKELLFNIRYKKEIDKIRIFPEIKIRIMGKIFLFNKTLFWFACKALAMISNIKLKIYY